VTKGQQYYDKFTDAIVHYFTRHFKNFVAIFLTKGTDAVISSVLVGVLDYLLAGGRKLQEKLDFLDSLTKSHQLLGFLKDHFEDSFLLKVVKKSLALDSKLLQRSSADFRRLFCEIYLKFLSRSVPLSFKIEAMEVLHHFFNFPGEHTDKLEKNLELMVANQFPITSKDYPSGTVQFNEYIAALDKLLNALILSGSLEILRVLITVICKEDTHVHGDSITKGFQQFVAKLAPPKAKEAVELCFRIFQDRNHKVEYRKRVLQSVAVPFLLKSDPTVAEQSLTKVVAFVMTSLSAPLLGDEAATVDAADQLRLKICCFELVEVIFTQLSTPQVNSSTSLLNSVYYDSKSDWKDPKGGESSFCLFFLFLWDIPLLLL